MVTMEGTPSVPSRSPSPAPSESSVDGASAVPGVVCRWNECGRSFANIPGLVEHLDKEHINGRANYVCEWTSCARRGIVQASRFALVSHCRSHTGERPFVCQLPNCDKTFTRSDTLAKHMRQKHQISPAAVGRGGHRKRKRSYTPSSHAAAAAAQQQQPWRRRASPDGGGSAPSHYNFANRHYVQRNEGRGDSGFNTFRVNPPPVYPLPPQQQQPQPAPQPLPPRVEESSDDEDNVPYNPEVAGGRSRAMVRYLVMKAKYRYVMDQQVVLTDELEALKLQEREEWREKEVGVDRVLRVLGPQSEQLIHDPDTQVNGQRPESHRHLMDIDVIA